MTTKYSNPCIRCGKERIVVRTWKEKIYSSIIINTEMACPDKECQKKVDSDNKKQRDRNAAMKLRSSQRAMSRKASKGTKQIPKKHKK